MDIAKEKLDAEKELMSKAEELASTCQVHPVAIKALARLGFSMGHRIGWFEGYDAAKAGEPRGVTAHVNTNRDNESLVQEVIGEDYSKHFLGRPATEAEVDGHDPRVVWCSVCGNSECALSKADALVVCDAYLEIPGSRGN